MGDEICWLTWTPTKIKETGKFDKVPHYPVSGARRNGTQGSDNDVASLGTYQEAIRALNDRETLAGLGIALLPQFGLVALDVDHCIENGEVRPDVLELVADTYAEISPSGTGVRAFYRGDATDSKNHDDGYELFHSKGFVTVTGRKLPESPSQVAELTQEKRTRLEALASKTRLRRHDGGALAPSQTLQAMSLGTTGLDETENAITRVKSALRSISADCGYEDWRNIVFAIKSLGWKCGEDLARTWSLTAPGRYEESAFDNLWRSAKQWGGITVGTLFFHAKEKGWIDPGGATVRPRTDMFNGRTFAQMYVGIFLFVRDRKSWLKWDEARWVWSDSEGTMAAAKAVADALINDATRRLREGAQNAEADIKHAIRTQALSKLKAMVELAKSEPGMSIASVAELDANPWLLGVQNGVVSLKVGTLLTPDPGMLMSRQCRASFNREAECPNWLRFMEDVFQRDGDTIDTVQRALGYTLTGTTTEERLFICHGPGANGKSVFGNVIAHVMGDYAAIAPPSILTLRRDGDTGPRNDLAALAGARLVSINETQSGDRLDEQGIKMLAGREPISARFLYGEYFSYQPAFTPWLRTNHRPQVHGDDEGIWRRLVLIPFSHHFSEEERDLHLEEKLMAERDGILMWMLDGAQRYINGGGLKLSARILAESREYRTESDLLGEFIEEKTKRSVEGRVPQASLYLSYRDWCADSGIRCPLSKKSFTQKLSERGYGVAKSGADRYYTGLVQLKI